MDASKQYLKDNNIIPFISFKGGQKYTVELISDENTTITDASGEKITGLSYTVMEDGQKKKFFTSSVGLIQQLSNCAVGDKMTIQMKSRKGPNGFQSYYEVFNITTGENAKGVGRVEDEANGLNPADIPF